MTEPIYGNGHTILCVKETKGEIKDNAQKQQ